MFALIDRLLSANGLSHLLGHTESLLGAKYDVTGGNPLDSRKKRLAQEIMDTGRTDIKVRLLPDVSAFSIELGAISALLLSFGIMKRMGSQVSITRNKNSVYNRYLMRIYLLSVLYLQKGDQRKLWSLWRIVIKRSNVYMMLCLHLIDKNLYRTKPLYDLYKILKRVDKLRRRLSTDMELRRVYIPKASSGSFAESERNTFRPLGVPSLPWRIYLNMLSHPLVLSMPVNSSQHGFTPNKGTETAWKEIFTKVLKSPNIYEIDLKQCFPSISLPRLRSGLLHIGKLPRWIVDLLIKLN